MNRRALCALAAPAIAVPFQLIQLALLFRGSPDLGAEWPQMLMANLVLLAGACALAADFPLADRSGRALLVGIGVPLLIPGPTVLDSLVRDIGPGLDPSSFVLLLLPNLLLLLLLGGAEAGIYLLATRPKTSV